MRPGNSSFSLRVRLRIGQETLPRAWTMLNQVNQNEWSDIVQQIVHEWHLLRDLAEADKKGRIGNSRFEVHRPKQAQWENSAESPNESKSTDLARFDGVDIGTLNY